jgi:hypothetical protein
MEIDKSKLTHTGSMNYVLQIFIRRVVDWTRGILS